MLQLCLYLFLAQAKCSTRSVPGQSSTSGVHSIINRCFGNKALPARRGWSLPPQAQAPLHRPTLTYLLHTCKKTILGNCDSHISLQLLREVGQHNAIHGWQAEDQEAQQHAQPGCCSFTQSLVYLWWVRLRRRPLSNPTRGLTKKAFAVCVSSWRTMVACTCKKAGLAVGSFSGRFISPFMISALFALGA